MTGLDDTLWDAICSTVTTVGKTIVMPGFFNLERLGVRTKTTVDDLVTDADEGAERALQSELAKLLPGALFVGEEMVARDASVLDAIGETETTIIVDPIDGTWNFANGVPLFGMMVAITRYGETVAGAIHYPLTGETIRARKGQGAFLHTPLGAANRLRARAGRPVGKMAGLVAIPLFARSRQEDLARRCTAFSRVTNFRCSAYEYRLIAQGSMDFSLNAGLMPWDHAAGTLIHQEAGGHAALLDGRCYTPTLTQGHLLLAPNKQAWDAVRTIVS
ncbi:inositol monophosphatase [Pelagibacterium sp. H642]|uniref:inositol monophosphatase family protein n=1 Tax=Pelagibacterium sp. H642 TaxID=1881069 RepID=UPI0028151751|nr:inositol monophosphatase [Pelagibacterium sp. H642]WMT90430.1 inositol monophosphatase [Pelagibacterium sp. H642]